MTTVRRLAQAEHGPEQGAVLITGTSSGIGMETALYLAERGFQVYATMRDLGRRGRLDAEATRRGVRLQVLQLDVTDRASIDAAVATCIAQSGGIYGLVNNAGILVRGYFEDVSDAEMRQVFETNLFGTMAVTRAVLPHMRAAGRGRIVIVTSVGGKMGSQSLTTYCATKFALEGFGEALALELRLLGLHVILVEPGITNTGIWGENRRVARRALDPSSAYGVWFRESEQLADAMVRSSSITCTDTARTVHVALTAARPKLRYLVGNRARIFFALRRYLPGEWFDRLYFGEVMRRVTRAALRPVK